MQKAALGLILLWIFFQGCSGLKKANISRKDKDYTDESLSSIIVNNISNHSFYIQKADITISENNSSTRFFAIIKYKKPDSLMISFRARIGYEAARMLLTKDTLIISDRINKKVMIGKPEAIKNKYGIESELIFAMFGDIIIEDKDRFGKSNCNNGILKKETWIRGRQLSYYIDCNKSKVISTSFLGDKVTDSVVINFSGFFNLGSIIIPGIIEARSNLSNIRITMKIEKAEIYYKGDIGFRSPTNYKVVLLK